MIIWQNIWMFFIEWNTETFILSPTPFTSSKSKNGVRSNIVLFTLIGILLFKLDNSLKKILAEF